MSPLGQDPDDGIREEIDHYLEERARELETEGMTPTAARRAAEEAFGDRSRIERQTLREDRRNAAAAWWESLWQDVRYALRGLRRSPGFAAAALLVLALGIGANTAVFSAAESVFLRTPPVREPGSLVAVYTTCRDGRPRCSSSYPDYLDYRDRSGLLEDLAARSSIAYSVADESGPPRLLATWLVTGNYFRLVGVRPAAGRLLTPEDHDPSAPHAVGVLAFGTWQDRYGGDPSVVGREIRVNGVPVEIVGVAPEGFRGIALSGHPELFLPMATGQLMGAFAVGRPRIFDERGSRWIDTLVGRLRPGATTAALQDEMTALGSALNETFPEDRGQRTVTVESASRYLLPQFGREDLTRLMALLGGVAGLTLVLACTNLANLLLARATVRRREMGLRGALGAARGRLLRQVLTEGVVLSLAGAALGLGVAWLFLQVLRPFTLPGGVSLAGLDAGLDRRALAFSAGVAVVTGVVFALAPGLRTWHSDIASSLKDSRGRAGGSAAGRGRRTLVAVQVALCLLLMVGSGLFLSTLARSMRTDLGFRPAGVALARFDLGSLGFTPEEGLSTLGRMRARLLALPGVEAVGWGSRVPLQVGGSTATLASITGYEPAPDEEIRVEYVTAGPGLLDALDIDLRRGRQILDPPPEEPAVLVNPTMADRYWTSPQAALGGSLELGGTRFAVAGITGPVHWSEVSEAPSNYVVVPAAFDPSVAADMPLTLAVRVRGDASVFLPALRSTLQSEEPDLTFYFVRTAEDLVRDTLAPQRMGSLVFSAFALLGLVLAATGIGGIVAYTMTRARREIGIRMALGARTGRVVRTAVLGMAPPVMAGLALGTLAALLAGRTVDAFLVGAGSADPMVYGVTVTALAVVAAISALWPATRAARVHPVEVLSQE